MPRDSDARLHRIAAKLTEARTHPALLESVFGADHHRFKPNAPLPEREVAEFEDRHGVTLPEEYRLFLTGFADGGAGPGCGLRRLIETSPSDLRRPSPYLPGPRYPDDWERVTWFGETLPLPGAELLRVLADAPSADRRVRAGESLLGLPSPGDAARTVVEHAARNDLDPMVRARLRDCLGWRADELDAAEPEPGISRVMISETARYLDEPPF